MEQRPSFMTSRLRKLISSLMLAVILFSSIFTPFSPLLTSVLAADYDLIVSDLTLTSLTVEQQLELPIQLVNTGELNWSPENIQIGYIWQNSEGLQQQGIPAPLVEPVNAESFTSPLQTISITAPSVPGDYLLLIDLVQAGTYLGLNGGEAPVSILPPNFQIEPTLVASVTGEVLLGAEFSINASITNQGSDIAHNAKLQIDLPEGIGLKQVTIPEYSPIEPASPQRISETQSVWHSFTSLGSQEAYPVTLTLEFTNPNLYKIADVLVLHLTASADTQIDDQLPINQIVSSTPHPVEIQIAAYSTNIGHQTEQLTGTETNTQQKSITVTNNPEQDSVGEVVIREILKAGLQYITGSQEVHNGILNSFNVLAGDPHLNGAQVGQTVLEWILQSLTTANYQTPLIISYLLGIPYQSNTGQVIQDGQTQSATTQVRATYEIDDQKVQLDQENQAQITAKHILISKNADNTNVSAGDTVNYTITITSSEYYSYTNLYIDDVLPDGLSFLSSGTAQRAGFPNTLEGVTSLGWLIPNLAAGSSVSIEYSALVQPTYNNSEPVTSNDRFNNSVHANGTKIDQFKNTALEAEADASNTVVAVKPKLLVLAWDAEKEDWTNAIAARIGDRIRLKVVAEFPANIPTLNTNIGYQLPPHTTLVADYGVSLNDQSLFNLETNRVEPGGIWTWEGEVQINNVAALANGTIIRQLAKLKYSNSAGQLAEVRGTSAITVVEPQIEVTKRLVVGYLAAGHPVTVEVVVANTGGSSAYGLSFLDNVFSNLSADSSSFVVTHGSCVVQFNQMENTIQGEVCNLDAGQQIKYTYQAIVDSAVITGSPIHSQISISEHSSLPAGEGRTYPASTHQTNWRGSEGALVTSIYLQDYSGQTQEDIGRAEQFIAKFVIRNIGGAPVYNLAASLQHIATDDWVVLQDPTAPINSIEIGELLPTQSLEYQVAYSSSTNLPFGRIYTASLEAQASDYLSRPIRKDVSVELNLDTDPLDATSAEFISVKRDFLPPTGQISFSQLGHHRSATNNHVDQVTMHISGVDHAQVGTVAKGIKAVRVWNPTSAQPGEDGAEWITVTELPIASDCEDWSECNYWDGTSFSIDFNFVNLEEGYHNRYVEAVDIDGNVALIGGSLIYDITPPTAEGGILIGLSHQDLSNPEFTSSGQNFLHYTALDELSGVARVRFAHGIDSYGGWIDQYLYGQFQNRIYDWGEVADGQVLSIFMQAMDAAGNIGLTVFQDTITVELGLPQLEVILNDGAQFTNQYGVTVHAPATDPESIAGHSSGIQSYRIISCDNQAECLVALATTPWQSYSEYTNMWLANPESSGRKWVCAQVKDGAGNQSEVACDSILLDTSAPTGSITINGGASQTSNRDVSVTIVGQDQVLQDGNAGFGQVEYRVSTSGVFWTNWNSLPEEGVISRELSLDTFIGQGVVYVQFRDGLDNQSGVYSASIEVNPGLSSGHIHINNDATFTNTELVTLTFYPSSLPTHMRIWNVGDNPEDSAIELYQKYKHWMLANPDELGGKAVQVQFIYGNDAFGPFTDSIILAPEYAIEYTLPNMPTQALSSDIIDVVLNVQNHGSLTWQAQSGMALAGEHPVNISYHWYREDGATVYQYEGNRALLSHSVAYSQSAEGLVLQVLTPTLPGRYVLKIDAVHEGVLWFSSLGNPTPSFTINIEQNPDYLPVSMPTGATLGEYDQELGDELGIGGTAYHLVQPGEYYSLIAERYYNCSANGIPNGSAMGGGDAAVRHYCWYPIYNANRHLYDGLTIPPAYWGNEWNLIHPGWVLTIPNVADTWIAQFVNQSAINITVKQGEAVLVRAAYKNVGTGHWEKSVTRLGTNQARNRTSVFQHQDWISTTRTSTFSENVTALPNAVVNFYFRFHAKPEQAPATYRECFAPVVDGKSWMEQQPVCWNVTVIPRDLPTGNIFCTLGTSLLDAPNGNQINSLPFSTQITVLTTTGNWAQVDYSGQTGWIDTACFNQTGTTPNGQQSSSDAPFYRPTGNGGVVLSTTGVNLRYGPALKFGWETTIPFGVSVEVLRQTAPGNDGLPGWYEVRLPDGRKGWVPAGYIDLADGYNPPVWTPPRPQFNEGHVCNTQGSAIALKWSPSWDSRTIELMSPDTNFRIIDVVGEWLYVSRLSGKSGYLHQSYGCEGFKFTNYGAGPGAYYGGITWGRPYHGAAVITSNFGPRDGGMHNGTDYGLACGTNLYAAAAGTVGAISLSGQVLGNNSDPKTPSNFVIINHDNGYQSYYWHMDKVAVEVGQKIIKGEYIGTSGNTGWVIGSSTAPLSQQGCHLHFEIRLNGNPLNPEAVLNSPPPPVPAPIGATSPGGGWQGGEVGGTSDIRNDYSSAYGATPSSPYAGMSWNSNTKITATFNHHFHWSMNHKETTKIAESVPAPTITMIQTNNTASQVTVYGVAVPKNAPVEVKVNNEYRICSGFLSLYCTTRHEVAFINERAEHVYVDLFKADGTKIGGGWNDSPDGRFSFTLNLGSNLKVGDQIYAVVNIHRTFTTNILNWWQNSPQQGVVLQLEPIKSGKSNTVQVPPRWISDPAERAIRQLEDQMGGAVLDGVIHDWCGYKVQDYHRIGAFQDSIAFYHPGHNRAYLVAGGIWWSYQTNGGCGEFGLPVSIEARTGKIAGWYQNFEKGTIYWAEHLSKSQPGIVKGDIREYYHSLGGTWSELGFPEGKQWGDTSFCGTSGHMQHFTLGRIYSSRFGNYWVKYGREFDYQNSLGLGGPNGTGWPRSSTYHQYDNPFTQTGYWHFERGTMNWNPLTRWFNSQPGCNPDLARPYDPDRSTHPAIKVIQDKEDSQFATFTRLNGGQGNGAIHTWQCGGQTHYLVDYSHVRLGTGQAFDHSVVLVNGNNAYLLSGQTMTHYFVTGGCDKYGLPTMDVETQTRPAKNTGTQVDWQAFTKATISRLYNSNHVQSVENQTFRIYRDEILGEHDKPFVHGYLGAPTSGWITVPKVEVSSDHYRLNVPGQIFQGGWIFYDRFEDKYYKVLNEQAMERLQNDIMGPTSSGAVVSSFLTGLATGFFLGLIPDGVEIAQGIAKFLLSLAGRSAAGPLSAAITVATAVVVIAPIVFALAELIPLIQDTMSGTPEEVASLAGGLIGGVLSGILVGGYVNSKATNLIAQLKDTALTLRTIRASGTILDQGTLNLIKRLSGGESTIGSADEILAVIKRSPVTTSRITGSLDNLTADEAVKVFKLAEKIPVDIDDIQPYLRFIRGDVSRLSADQTAGLIIFARRGQSIDVDYMLKVSNAQILPLLNAKQVDNIYDILRNNSIDLVQYKKLVERIPGGLWDKNYINKMLTESDVTLGGGKGHWYRDHVDVLDSTLRTRALSAQDGFVASRWVDESTARNRTINMLQSEIGITTVNQLINNPSEYQKLVTTSSSGITGSAFQNNAGTVKDVTSNIKAEVYIIRLDANGLPYIHTSYPSIK